MFLLMSSRSFSRCILPKNLRLCLTILLTPAVAVSVMSTSQVYGIQPLASLSLSADVNTQADGEVETADPWRRADFWTSRLPGVVLKTNASGDVSSIDVSKCNASWIEHAKHWENMNSLESIVANHPDTPAEALAHIGEVSGLKVLRLSGKAIDDKAITALATATRLAVLSLTNTSVTDAGLKSLSRLENLKELSLVGNEVSEQVLEIFKQSKSLAKIRIRNTSLLQSASFGELIQNFPNLVSLEVSEAGLEDQALSAIGQLPKLTELNLLRTQVTSAGLSAIQRRPLKRLNLDDIVGVDDDIFDTLSTLQSLEWLHLGKTRVTDEGIQRLEGLPNLKEVLLNDTAISDEAKRRLLDAKPGLKCTPMPL